MPVRISGRNPDRMSVWWSFPPARFPTVGIAIPAVISANPDMIPARADATMLTNTDRGTKPYYDLRMSRYYPKSKTEQRGKNKFSHFLLLRVYKQAYGRHRVSRLAPGTATGRRSASPRTRCRAGRRACISRTARGCGRGPARRSRWGHNYRGDEVCGERFYR